MTATQLQTHMTLALSNPNVSARKTGGVIPGALLEFPSSGLRAIPIRRSDGRVYLWAERHIAPQDMLAPADPSYIHPRWGPRLDDPNDDSSMTDDETMNDYLTFDESLAIWLRVYLECQEGGVGGIPLDVSPLEALANGFDLTRDVFQSNANILANYLTSEDAITIGTRILEACRKTNPAVVRVSLQAQQTPFGGVKKEFKTGGNGIGKGSRGPRGPYKKTRERMAAANKAAAGAKPPRSNKIEVELDTDDEVQVVKQVKGKKGKKDNSSSGSSDNSDGSSSSGSGDSDSNSDTENEDSKRLDTPRRSRRDHGAPNESDGNNSDGDGDTSAAQKASALASVFLGYEAPRFPDSSESNCLPEEREMIRSFITEESLRTGMAFLGGSVVLTDDNYIAVRRPRGRPPRALPSFYDAFGHLNYKVVVLGACSLINNQGRTSLRIPMHGKLKSLTPLPLPPFAYADQIPALFNLANAPGAPKRPFPSGSSSSVSSLSQGDRYIFTEDPAAKEEAGANPLPVTDVREIDSPTYCFSMCHHVDSCVWFFLCIARFLPFPFL